jgi:sucrose-6F-phosphate phosphohydrolase
MNYTLCTDLDRTLLPNGAQDSDPQAIPLLKMLVEQQQLRLVYVSGRNRELILDAINEYELPTPAIAITDVGTRIYHIDQVTDNHHPAHTWVMDHDWERYLANSWDRNRVPLLRKKLDLHTGLKLQEAEKQTEFKLSYYLDMQYYNSGIKSEIEHLCKELSLSCNIVKSHDETTDTGLLDILPGNASKYHAIRFLMDKYTIIEKEILFCGDSGNDMEVLASEIPAVLVNNAQQSVKVQAKQLAAAQQHDAQLYIATGNFYGLNGNYCSGILEGLAYYYQEFERLISLYLAESD